MITIDAIEEYFREQLTEYLSKETGSRHNAIIFKIRVNLLGRRRAGSSASLLLPNQFRFLFVY